MSASNGFPSGPIARQDGYITTPWLLLIQQLSTGTGGTVTAASVTNVPAGGITSTNVQAALNELDTKKQVANVNLTALAAQTFSSDKIIYWTGVNTASVTALTALARTLVANTTTAGMQSTLALGTMATQNSNAVNITGGSISSISFASPAITGTVSGGATYATITVTNGTFTSGSSTSMTLTSPTILAGTWSSGNIQITSGTIGWRTGAGTTSTQATNKNTTVVANAITGKITTANSSMAPGVYNVFTVTCSVCTATSMPVVGIISAPTPGAYDVKVTAIASGSFNVAIQNLSGFTLAEAVDIRYAVFNSADS